VVPQGLRMDKNVRGHCQKETIHFDRTNRRGSKKATSSVNNHIGGFI
jgi:hypothetical protein